MHMLYRVRLHRYLPNRIYLLGTDRYFKLLQRWFFVCANAQWDWKQMNGWCMN